MKTEIEAKFLNIDFSEIRKKLLHLGATPIHPERLMKRQNFDYPDYRLKKSNGWIRVRDEGNKITLSYKQLNTRTLHGTKEISVQVNNFTDTCLFLKTISLVDYSYQETKRESWLFEKTEIELDTWPWIPPFMEIEGPSEKAVKYLANQLELDWSQALFGSVEIVYQNYYNVTEAEVDSWPEIKFKPVPSWLAKKKK